MLSPLNYGIQPTISIRLVPHIGTKLLLETFNSWES